MAKTTISNKQHIAECEARYVRGGKAAVLEYTDKFDFPVLYCRGCESNNPSLQGECLVCGQSCYVVDQPEEPIKATVNIEEGNIEIPKTYGTHLVVLLKETNAVIGILINIGKVPNDPLIKLLQNHFDGEVNKFSNVEYNPATNYHFWANIKRNEDECFTPFEFIIQPAFLYT